MRGDWWLFFPNGRGRPILSISSIQGSVSCRPDYVPLWISPRSRCENGSS